MLRTANRSILWLAVLIADAGYASSSNESSWTEYSNKYGWEVGVPKCAKVADLDDPDFPPPKDRSVIIFRGDKSCLPDLETKEWLFSAQQTIQVPLHPPQSRINSNFPLAQRANRETKLFEKMVGGRLLKGYHSVGKPNETGVWYSITLHSSCADKNSKVSIGYFLPDKDKSKPLAELKLPASLDRILSSYKCNKP